jgi:hypothetical protein
MLLQLRDILLYPRNIQNITSIARHPTNSFPPYYYYYYYYYTLSLSLSLSPLLYYGMSCTTKIEVK